MDTKKIIPIFFTINDQYAPYLSTAIDSIIKNSSKEYYYKIFILHDGLSPENISKLSVFDDNRFEINFKEMKKGLEAITDRIENRLRCDYFTVTIYFRLFIADMFTEFDKGIYIDSDIIVPGDISELYNHNLGNNLIGAVTDNSIQEIPELVNYVENAVGIPRREYINSGVLLMNLKLMREKEFSKKFLNLLTTYHFDSIAPDQDYINVMCNGKILYLDEEWDAMPNPAREEIKQPKLIHYNLFQKPWCYDNIQYQDEFWKYANQSNYYNLIIQNKNNYSDVQKESDNACLGVLVKKGNDLPDTEVTFKKVFEKGADLRL